MTIHGEPHPLSHVQTDMTIQTSGQAYTSRLTIESARELALAADQSEIPLGNRMLSQHFDAVTALVAWITRVRALPRRTAGRSPIFNLVLLVRA